MALVSIATSASSSTSVSGPAATGRLPLTEAAVEAIAAIEDVAVRNLWITQSYADLAHRLLEVLPPDQTWCTFAIWASNTAGKSIRGAELPRIVSQVLLGADAHISEAVRKTNWCTAALQRLGVLHPLQHSHLEHLVAQAVGQVSVRIADGNTLVYRELAPLFVRFLDRIDEAGPAGFDELDAALDSIGIPSSTAAPEVREAFQNFGLALAPGADPSDRAQYVLAGNIAAVAHEQRRLQADITDALDAGLLDFGNDLCGTVHGQWAEELLRPLGAEIRAHITPHLEAIWQEIATHTLMTLCLPDETLDLGRDVPRLPGQDTLFPPVLVCLNQPMLCALMAEWDATNGTGVGSAAHDWANLHQRMSFIVNLFRSRQQFLHLTTPPFSSNDLAWMDDDELPPRFALAAEPIAPTPEALAGHQPSTSPIPGRAVS